MNGKNYIVQPPATRRPSHRADAGGCEGDTVVVTGTAKQNKKFLKMINKKSSATYKLDNENRLVVDDTKKAKKQKSATFDNILTSSVSDASRIPINLIDSKDPSSASVFVDDYDNASVDIGDLKKFGSNGAASLIGHLLYERLNTANYANPANRTDANYHAVHYVGAMETEGRIIAELFKIPYQFPTLKEEPQGYSIDGKSISYTILRTTDYGKIIMYVNVVPNPSVVNGKPAINAKSGLIDGKATYRRKR